MVCPSKPYHFKLFKGCLPQILPGPFLNTLTQIQFYLKNPRICYKETETQPQNIFWELPKNFLGVTKRIERLQQNACDRIRFY